MVLNKISIFSNYNNITNKDCIEDSKDTGDRNKGIGLTDTLVTC